MPRSQNTTDRPFRTVRAGADYEEHVLALVELTERIKRDRPSTARLVTTVLESPISNSLAYLTPGWAVQQEQRAAEAHAAN